MNTGAAYILLSSGMQGEGLTPLGAAVIGGVVFVTVVFCCWYMERDSKRRRKR